MFNAKVNQNTKKNILASGDAQTDPNTDEVIEVTIPLQCLVKDSKLVLHELSKVRFFFINSIIAVFFALMIVQICNFVAFLSNSDLSLL